MPGGVSACVQKERSSGGPPCYYTDSMEEDGDGRRKKKEEQRKRSRQRKQTTFVKMTKWCNALRAALREPFSPRERRRRSKRAEPPERTWYAAGVREQRRRIKRATPSGTASLERAAFQGLSHAHASHEEESSKKEERRKPLSLWRWKTSAKGARSRTSGSS